MKRIKIYRLCLIISIVAGSIAVVISSMKFLEQNIPKDMYVNANENISQVKKEIENDVVYPCGKTVGLYLHTSGVLVIGEAQIDGKDGKIESPAKGLIEKGDYITQFNSEKVETKAQLISLVSKNEDKNARIKINRQGRTVYVSIKPVRDERNGYKLGIWVRDDTQGLGTITYVTKDGKYGALGHGISDLDTGDMLESYSGDLYNAQIWGVKKGSKGEPGGFCGAINYVENEKIGTIYKNTPMGIFGKLDMDKADINNLEPMKIAKAGEVKEGNAQIIVYFDGKYEKYDVEISKVKFMSSANKNLIIKIKDERLIKRTNGIIQGMSGAPVIQDGKLVAAVTHVFVNEPSKGYGIYASSMIEMERKNN